MYNPYKVLGVTSSFKKKDIKTKYRKLSRKYHPDNLVTGDANKFQEIARAWEYIDKNHKDTSSVKRHVGIFRHNSLFNIKEEM